MSKHYNFIFDKVVDGKGVGWRGSFWAILHALSEQLKMKEFHDVG
jgi:hypothetical protein